MCLINCSGGCPECAPQDHVPECVAQYNITHHCICDKLIREGVGEYYRRVAGFKVFKGSPRAFAVNDRGWLMDSDVDINRLVERLSHNYRGR